MKKAIFVEQNIQELVDALNRIRGAKTVSSCDGHDCFPARVTFSWSTLGEESIPVLLRIAREVPGVLIRQVVGQRRMIVYLDPTWADSSLESMQHAIRQELQRYGCLLQGNPFEIKSWSTHSTDGAPTAGVAQGIVPMTSGKFELLKLTTYRNGLAEANACHSIDPIPNAHQECSVGNHQRRLPTMIYGTPDAGSFHYQVNYDRPEHHLLKPIPVNELHFVGC